MILLVISPAGQVALRAEGWIWTVASMGSSTSAWVRPLVRKYGLTRFGPFGAVVPSASIDYPVMLDRAPASMTRPTRSTRTAIS